MYNQEYFEKLDHYGILEKIILQVLKEEDIYIGYGKDDLGWFAGISNGEIDNNQTIPALHCYGDNKFYLNISFYNDDLEEYDEFKKLIDEEHLPMIPEGLLHLMIKVFSLKKEITINVNELSR